MHDVDQSIDSALLILAAGAGSRAGGPKALVKVGERTALEVLVAGYAPYISGPIIAVVQPRIAARLDARPDLPPGLILVINDEPDVQGASDSLALGLRMLSSELEQPVPVLVSPVDCPPVQESTIRALRAHIQSTGAPAGIPVHQGQAGHPVLLSTSTWPTLALRPRRLDQWLATLEPPSTVPVEDPGVTYNFNTAADWQEWEGGGSAVT